MTLTIATLGLFILYVGYLLGWCHFASCLRKELHAWEVHEK